MRLVVEDVGKLYPGGIWGLRGVSIELGPGVLGLVGPNGAGKSTLLRILATVTKPTEGRVVWNGADLAKSPNAVRTVLGYLPQDFGIYPHLNAIEFLEYLAALKGLSGRQARQRIDDLIQMLGLIEVCKRPLSGYSGGMRQRVGIAQALLNDPHLLIVDEPTTGLDPGERVNVRNLLADLAGDRIVVLSTHIVSDVEAAASDIAILNRGQLLGHLAPEELLAAVEGKVWELVVPGADLAETRRTWLVTNIAHRSDGVHVRIVAARPPSSDARPVAPLLEDAYLHRIESSSVGGRP